MRGRRFALRAGWCGALIVASMTGARAAEPPQVPQDAAPRSTTNQRPKFELPEGTVAVMGILPTWRYTGTLGATFPRLLSLELLARFKNGSTPRWDLFAVGVSLDYLPTGVARFADGTTTSWFSTGLEGKWFLWRGLFVGGRAGWQLSRGDVAGDSRAHVTSSLVASPKIGVLHTFLTAGRTLGGFTVGADVGVDVPVAVQRSSAAESSPEAGRVSDRFAGGVWPTFTLRLGYTISERVR